MDAITIISAIVLSAGLIVWLVPRLGVALKIPLFVRWEKYMEEKERIRKVRCSIRFDADGIKVVVFRDPKSSPLEIGWNAIDRLTMFKRDCFAIDLICLCLEFSSDCAIELDEHMDGWQAFVEALPHYVPGCQASEEWFCTVAFPAFATNPTEIYRRDAAQKT